tara:strand:- start:7901 stop:9448 length:1548 start_codon:yes stop_codon:yes gene_type:complete
LKHLKKIFKDTAHPKNMANINTYANKITKAAGIMFIGLVFSRLFTYFYVILLARLGSSTYGLLTLGFTVITFLSTLTLMGLKPALLRFISFYKGKNDERRVKGTILTSMKISIPLSIIVAILVFIFAKDIANLFHNPDLTLLLRMMAVLIPIRGFNRIFMNSITAFQKIKQVILIDHIIRNVVKLGLTFILILMGMTILGPVIAFMITILVVFVLSFYTLEKKVFPIIKTKVKAVYNRKELLLFAVPLLFSDFLVDIAKWADTWFIGAFRTTSEVGIYNVALPTANLLVLIPTALMAIFIPIITELYAKDKLKEIKKIGKLISKWIFFVNLPLIGFLIIFSKDLLRIVFGAEYVAAYPIITLLAIGHIFYSLYHIPANILQMIKKTRIIFLIFAIAVIINITLNAILIPTYGMIGAAIGTVSYFISLYILVSLFAYRLRKMQFLRWIYLKAIISLLVTSFLIIQISKVLLPSSLINVLILSLIFITIYSGIIILLKGLEEEDYEVINNIKKKFKR